MEAPVKPVDVDQYTIWLSSELHFVLDARWKNHYETVATKMNEQAEASALWRGLIGELREIDALYYSQTGFYLFMGRDVPVIVLKPYASIVDKSFRKNVLLNRNWPGPPTPRGWVTPDRWISEINDIVRTVFVVRYLDGVPFLAKVIEARAGALNLPVRIDYEAREEGYYAAHVYVTLPAEVPRITWDMEQVEFPFELQITTQLQDSIRPITHPFYVGRRSQTIPPMKPWQWEFQTDEFRANFLAHTLHHVEGLIVDVRENLRRRG